MAGAGLVPGEMGLFLGKALRAWRHTQALPLSNICCSSPHSPSPHHTSSPGFSPGAAVPPLSWWRVPESLAGGRGRCQGCRGFGSVISASMMLKPQTQTLPKSSHPDPVPGVWGLDCCWGQTRTALLWAVFGFSEPHLRLSGFRGGLGTWQKMWSTLCQSRESALLPLSHPGGCSPQALQEIHGNSPALSSRAALFLQG